MGAACALDVQATQHGLHSLALAPVALGHAFGCLSAPRSINTWQAVHVRSGIPLPIPALHCHCVYSITPIQFDVKKLAELAKSSSGHKRMRLDTAAAQQQLKQLLQQEQADLEQPSDEAQQASSVLVKQEQQEQSALDAAAAADGIKLEPAAAGQNAAAGEQQDLNVPPDGAYQ
jgi:hypothetical protein